MRVIHPTLVELAKAGEFVQLPRVDAHNSLEDGTTILRTRLSRHTT